MKVLVLSHLFPRHEEDWNGVFVHEQVAALRAGGIDARVLTGDPAWITWSWGRTTARWVLRRHTPPGSLAWREIRGVPVAVFRYASPFAPDTEKAAAWCYAREAAAAASWARASVAFDLVHAHTSFLDGNAGARIARRFRVPFVLTEHTGPFSALTASPLMAWQTGRAIARADAVLAVSHAEREAMLRGVRIRRPERIEVLPNGVRTDVFHPGGGRPPDDGAVHVLWVGGLVPVKRLDLLLDAFADARRERPELRLTLLGDGPLEGEVRRKIEALDLAREVGLAPSTSRAGVAAALRAHHFLVVSSETESFSLVTIEALACGRPVLSTRCGGPESILVSPRLGELVDRTRSALARGLVSMAGRLPEFDEAALADHARREFGIEAVAKRTIAVYERVRRRAR